MRPHRFAHNQITRNMSPSVVQHYTEGSLMSRIMDGLSSTGIDMTTITPQQLYPVDQFHVGGLKALKSLLSHVNITPSCRVLDLGCGIGGTSRLIAAQNPGTSVLGIDVTPEFVEVSKELTSMVNMEGITYEVGSATEIPTADNSIDLILMVYVGMNIEDKKALFAEAHRVLTPGGTFAIKDAMLEDNKTQDDIIFPVPWATNPSQSFATHPEAYLEAAMLAGFECIVGPISCREEGHSFVRNAPPSGPPPLSLPRITFGLNGMAKMKNILSLIRSETIFPCEIVFKKRLD